jgi:hypothetical protein
MEKLSPCIQTSSEHFLPDFLRPIARSAVNKMMVLLAVVAALLSVTPAVDAATYTQWTNCTNSPSWPVGGPNNQFTMVMPGDQIIVTFSGASCQRVLLPPQNGDGTYPLNSTMSVFNVANARLVSGSDLVLTFVAESSLPLATYGSSGWTGSWYAVGQNSYSSPTSTAGNGVPLSFGTPPNSMPTVSGVPSTVSVIEDNPSTLSLSTLALADADGDTLTVDLSVSAGSFSVPSAGSGVTATQVSSSRLRFVGLAGDLNAYFDDSSKFTYTTIADAQGNGVAIITLSATDGTANLASNPTISVNSTNTPDVTGVNASTADGYYKADDVVTVSVTFDSAVALTGPPRLTLETGLVDRFANYTSGNC